MKHVLLDKVIELQTEINKTLLQKRAEVRAEVLFEKIENDNNTIVLMNEIVDCAMGWGGLDVREIVAHHYDLDPSLFVEIDDKETIKTLLLNKIQSVIFTEEYDELFFEESEITKEIREKVQSIYKEIAICAIRYIFADSELEKLEKTELQVNAFKAILRLCDIPELFDIVTIRNLLSVDRLKSITKSKYLLKVLKQTARNWYQQSNYKFLERKDGYHYYTYVPSYLYILSSEQLERLRQDFLEEAEQKYHELKEKVNECDHTALIQFVDFLKEQIEEILSWEVESV